MLNTRDWWDIPCNQWRDEDLFAAERAGHFVIPQVLKNDIARFERRELADDTGGSGPNGSKRGGNPSGNPPSGGNGRERSQRRQTGGISV
eukprot:12399407-Karenia_brevis.AAC.1